MTSALDVMLDKVWYYCMFKCQLCFCWLSGSGEANSAFSGEDESLSPSSDHASMEKNQTVQVG